MSLITPSSGLLFWMVIIFAIVFFILAKFGFPIITGSIKKRQDHISASLQDAQKASQMLASMDDRYKEMLDKARDEQAALIAQAKLAAAGIVEEARQQAAKDAEHLLAQAREAIEIQKREAIEDMCATVANIAVAVSEKILGDELSSKDKSEEYTRQLLEQTQRADRS